MSFMFWTGAQIQMHLLNKAQHKNLVRPGHLLKGHTKAATSKKCHLGMPAWPNYNQFFKKKFKKIIPKLIWYWIWHLWLSVYLDCNLAQHFNSMGTAQGCLHTTGKLTTFECHFQLIGPDEMVFRAVAGARLLLPHMGSFCWSIFLPVFFMGPCPLFSLFCQ